MKGGHFIIRIVNIDQYETNQMKKTRKIKVQPQYFISSYVLPE